MAAPEIRPFSEEHLDEAARLLAGRHARHREAEPLLPGEVDFRGQIEREWHASGVVALVKGEVAAYLVGRMSDDDCLVNFAGCATRDAELIRDLYASLAGRWVEAGHVRHRVHVPASESGLVDAWFRLAFGRQLTFGVRETEKEPAPKSDVTVRPGEHTDLASTAALARLLVEHQVLAPSFSGRTVATDGAYRDPAYVHFVAEREGRVVGHVLLYRRPADDLRIPSDNIDLAHAVTATDTRGSGVGATLTAYALTWAHEVGFRSMTVDWRDVNLLASRFWPRRGFRPTFFRLYRQVP